MAVEKWSQQIWIAHLANEPTLSEDLTALKLEIDQAAPHPNVIYDLSQVELLTSSNISQLLRLRKQAVDHDVKMRLVAISNAVWVVFLTTGLDKVFNFATDVSTALAGLKMDESV